MLSPRMTDIIIVLVSFIWAVNFFAGLILPNYEADQMINTIFMAIVGGAIAFKVNRENKEQRERRDPDKPTDGENP